MKTAATRPNEKYILATSSTDPRYRFHLLYRGREYGIIYESYIMTNVPVAFDYSKRFLAIAKQMELAGLKRRRFTLVATVEDIDAQNATGVKVRFLMPGHINQTHTFFLDPQRQDFKGKKGLRINCIMEEILSDYSHTLSKHLLASTNLVE